MTQSELHWLSTTELVAALASGEVSSREVLAHFVQRIEALDGPINAVVHCRRCVQSAPSSCNGRYS